MNNNHVIFLLLGVIIVFIGLMFFDGDYMIVLTNTGLASIIISFILLKGNDSGRDKTIVEENDNEEEKDRELSE